VVSEAGQLEIDAPTLSDQVSIAVPTHEAAEVAVAPASTSVSQQKRLGTYYTPRDLAQVLCKWAIRRPDDKVLEPSFGGCGFLEESLARLLDLGASNPLEQVAGCDVDPVAFYHLAEMCDGESPPKDMLQADFLALEPSSFFIAPFHAVVGNPPFVSHHNMSAEQKQTAHAVRAGKETIDRRSSLWAYFVCHATRFIAKQGRLAFVLPMSFVYTDYAACVQRLLERSFRRVLVVHLNQRVFTEQGTEEKALVLLADGFGAEKTQPIQFAEASTLSQLVGAITQWGVLSHCSLQRHSLTRLPDSALSAFERQALSPQATDLGAKAIVRIGLVTGDTSFFLLNESEAAHAQLEESGLVPALRRLRDCPGLFLDIDRFQAIRASGKRCLLISPDNDKLSMAFQTYLNSYSKKKREANVTFAKRKPWFRISVGRVPDAFFSCVMQSGPSLVLNSSRCTSTNTLHHVTFKDGVTELEKKVLAISIRSTFTQLSAELVGRTYSAGGLKLEPSEVQRLKMLLPEASRDEVESVFRRVDEHLRAGQVQAATQEADRFVWGPNEPGDAAILRDALSVVRHSRVS
jgi:adenine-specific DNA-methyltransferase